MNALLPTNSKLFFSRQDKSDPRLGDLIPASTKIEENAWHLVGYPDDEGIKLNGGRVGAAQAPDSIRRFLYKMTPNSSGTDNAFDLGNHNLASGDIHHRHQAAFEYNMSLFEKGGLLIAMGGGHDYGYSDCAAFAKSFIAQRPLVINFDAHLDVRPFDGTPHSGTPFRRLLTDFPNVSFCEIGIQSQCNAKAHFDWLRDQGGKVLSLDEIMLAPTPAHAIHEFLLPHLEQPRAVFVSIDLDAFSSSFAPGCSQSWPTGLSPAEVLTTLDTIKARGNIKGLGLYEVSPPLDVDDRTSRLAALLIHRVMRKASRSK